MEEDGSRMATSPRDFELLLPPTPHACQWLPTNSYIMPYSTNALVHVLEFLLHRGSRGRFVLHRIKILDEIRDVIVIILGSTSRCRPLLLNGLIRLCELA